MRTGRCIDQLAGNANFSGCLADTTFQQIADAELTPDLFDIDGPPFVSKARIAGDDEQQPEPRECRSDVVDYAIREIVLLRIGAHNLERQHRDGRPIRKGKRFSVINGQVVRPWWHGATVWNAPHPHRFGDILQRLRTQILKRNIYLATNLPMCIVRNADTARFCDPFETHRNIDPVTKDIVFFDNNITEVNADAKFDPFVLRHIGILFCHAALDFVGTSHGVDTLPRVGPAFLTRGIDFFRPQLRNGIWDRSVKLSGFYRSGARHISATDLTQYLLADLIVRVENTGFSYASAGPLGSRLNRLAFPTWNSSLRGR